MWGVIPVWKQLAAAFERLDPVRAVPDLVDDLGERRAQFQRPQQ
jgi:hypothetical protein